MAMPTKFPTPKTHRVALLPHPAYPARAPVSQVDWSLPDPGYAPVSFTHPAVLSNDCSVVANGWADPAQFTPDLVANRVSNALGINGKVPTDPKTGRPRNPLGRTGLEGRGLLGKYGPNYAADPLVTRFDPSTGQLQMVVIQRADTLQWAIPGGMVDQGEQVSLTLKREFVEETRNLADSNESELVGTQLAELFDQKLEPVFCGYVDDPRNTDEAWMETTCVHFHIDSPFLAQHLRLEGGDDAVKAKWADVSDNEPEFKNLYASHRDMVIRALLKNPSKFGAAIAKTSLL